MVVGKKSTFFVQSSKTYSSHVVIIFTKFYDNWWNFYWRPIFESRPFFWLRPYCNYWDNIGNPNLDSDLPRYIHHNWHCKFGRPLTFLCTGSLNFYEWLGFDLDLKLHKSLVLRKDSDTRSWNYQGWHKGFETEGAFLLTYLPIFLLHFDILVQILCKDFFKIYR